MGETLTQHYNNDTNPSHSRNLKLYPKTEHNRNLTLDPHYAAAFRFNLGRDTELIGRDKMQITLTHDKMKLNMQFSICKKKLPKRKLTLCTNALHSYSAPKMAEWLEYNFMIGTPHPNRNSKSYRQSYSLSKCFV